MTMAQILTNVGDIVTALVGWIGQFATAITSNHLDSIKNISHIRTPFPTILSYKAQQNTLQ